MVLTNALQEINDEEIVLKNTHKQLEKMMRMEYDMKEVIINVNTYAEQDYIHHLSAINLFINRTMNVPDTT